MLQSTGSVASPIVANVRGTAPSIRGSPRGAAANATAALTLPHCMSAPFCRNRNDDKRFFLSRQRALIVSAGPGFDGTPWPVAHSLTDNIKGPFLCSCRTRSEPSKYRVSARRLTRSPRRRRRHRPFPDARDAPLRPALRDLAPGQRTSSVTRRWPSSARAKSPWLSPTSRAALGVALERRMAIAHLKQLRIVMIGRFYDRPFYYIA